MNINSQIRKRLKELGLRPNMKSEIESLGVEVTVCQLIVVVLSIASVVFLLVPFLYLRDLKFIFLFWGISIVCIWIGIWFWVKRADICEHPEEYTD